MDFVPTRGQVILDDSHLRLRTTGAVTRLTDLFALKADESSVSTRFADRPTSTEVTAEIAAAIDALKGDAPGLLDTLGEIADALNDDHDVYNTLLAFINAKQASLTVPSAAGISLLSGTDLRRLEATGNATITDNSNRVTLDISGVSAATFASHQTSVATSLAGKQDTLASGGGTGVPILDTANDVVRRIRLYGNVSTSSDADEVLVHIMGRTDAEVNTLLAQKQDTLTNNSGSTGEQLLTGTTLRKIRAGSNVSLSLVDGDLSISSTGGVTASDVATSIAAAVSAYTLTSTLTTQLAAKQDLLSSAGGTGNAILASNVIKRIDFDGDFAISDNGSKITVSLSSALSTKQDNLTNFSGVSGFELFSSGKLKRLNVPLSTSLGVPLQMAENNTGELTLTSNSYSYQMVDTLLAAKQATLSVSSVAGSTLLNGTTLKRIAAGDGIAINDSGHSLELSSNLAVDASAGGTPVVDLRSDGSQIVRKLDLHSSNSSQIVQMSSSGGRILLTTDGHTKAEVASLLSSYATTAAMTAAISTQASASYLDAVTYTNNQVSGKQDSLQWLASTGTAFINSSDLNVRRLQANAPVSINIVESGRSILLHADCYSKSESNSRYLQTDPQSITFTNTNGPELNVIARGSQSNIEFKGGTLRIRRESPSGSFTSHLQFPDSQNGNAYFFNSVTADAFQTSDNRLKDNQEEITAEEALSILEAVAPKKYTRNDKNHEKRHGFVAQELEAACSGHFACLVGTTEIIDDEIQPMKTVDYARLSAILWTCVRDLHSKLEVLDVAHDVALLPGH